MPTAHLTHNAARKGFRHGTHRLVPPEDTLERVRRHLSAMGVTRIANVTGLDYVGVPVVMVCRPNSRSLAVAQGKGPDLPSAKASGVMEAIENYHAERIDESRKIVRASARDLATEGRLADPDRLPRVSSSRYRTDIRISWVEGYDLLQSHPVWVPYELVHTNYTRPLPAGSGCFLASTNGLASGNCELEAVCHAICEVIERDALALAQAEDRPLTCLSAPRLLLETVDDEACQEVLAKFRQAGLWTTVYDITSDIGVPCFFCRIDEATDGAPPFCPKTEGFGCHSSREVALLRALTEAAQSRLTLISGSRDDLRDRYYPTEAADRGETWEQLINPYSTRWLRFDEIPTYDSLTFEADLSFLLARLRSVGVEQVISIDLSRRDFGIAVNRVVIPGLEGFSLSPDYHAGERARVRGEQAG